MPGPAFQSVPVPLGARAYEVRIGTGLLACAREHVDEVLGTRRALIVADEALARTPHLEPLRQSLDAPVLQVPSGEPAKSLTGYGALMEALLAHRPDRRTLIAALGGGVAGDLAGFAAATLLRGVPFVQVPTTLLAQVDSAVGGKTGINSRHGKNLVGAFHQPALVLADLDTLATLPPRERRCGYVEALKYGLLGDAAYFDWLETNGAAALAGDLEALKRLVATAVAGKAEVVVADEEERQDRRALLNLGHTFGHAYEALTGYGTSLLHGEAVALGIVQAFRLSVRLGLCPPADLGRVEAHLVRIGMEIEPRTIGRFEPRAVLDAMGADKKAVDGKLAFILVRGVGAAFVSREVPEAVLLDHLREAA